MRALVSETRWMAPDESRWRLASGLHTDTHSLNKPPDKETHSQRNTRAQQEQAMPDGSQMTKVSLSTSWQWPLTAASKPLPEAAGIREQLNFLERGHCPLDSYLCHLTVTG